MSNTVAQIADQLRACNFEHVRAVIEPDDNIVLLDYLESQGFVPLHVPTVEQVSVIKPPVNLPPVVREPVKGKK